MLRAAAELLRPCGSAGQAWTAASRCVAPRFAGVAAPRHFSSDDKAGSGEADAGPQSGKHWREWMEDKLSALDAPPSSSPSASRLLASRRPKGSFAEQVVDIVASSPAPDALESGDLGGRPAFGLLARAGDESRRGWIARADEVSPARVHPSRIFYPGQTYAPGDLDPYAPAAAPTGGAANASAIGSLTPGQVAARADFRDPGFLSTFLSETGQITPRRRTGLPKKLHSAVGRQIKIARAMGMLPHDGRALQARRQRR